MGNRPTGTGREIATAGASATRAFAVLLVVVLAGCVDQPSAVSPTPEPWSERALADSWRLDGIIAMYSVSGDSCPDVPACEVIDDPAGPDKLCICELEGILVNPADPPSLPPPSWPPAPGWYPPLPGGGGGGEGEPCEWGCAFEVTPKLTCDTEVTRGDPVQCVLTEETGNAPIDHVYRWVFQPDLGGAPVVKDPGGSTSWSGIAVTSGDVRVVFRLGGSDMWLASRIEVGARNWSWDSSRRSFQQGVPGDLDSCVGARSGLVADVHGCAATGNPGLLMNPGPNQGYTPTPVTDGGPSHGLWYLTNPTTRMDLRSQVNRKYRPDEPTVTVTGDATVLSACSGVPQNNFSVNTGCLANAGFTSFWNFAWAHEAAHLAAAQPEAAKPGNDLYLGWEELVYGSENELRVAANNEQSRVHDAVQTAADAIHTGGQTPFNFWYLQGGGLWTRSLITVNH